MLMGALASSCLGSASWDAPGSWSAMLCVGLSASVEGRVGDYASGSRVKNESADDGKASPRRQIQGLRNVGRSKSPFPRSLSLNHIGHGDQEQCGQRVNLRHSRMWCDARDRGPYYYMHPVVL